MIVGFNNRTHESFVRSIRFWGFENVNCSQEQIIKAARARESYRVNFKIVERSSVQRLVSSTSRFYLSNESIMFITIAVTTNPHHQWYMMDSH